jgi:hypothetical protein
VGDQVGERAVDDGAVDEAFAGSERRPRRGSPSRVCIVEIATSACCAAAVEILEPLGDAWALQHAEAALGRVVQATGRYADAARHHWCAAAATERLGFPGATAMHLMHLAMAQLAGDDPAAAATLERATAGAREAGDQRLLTQTRVTAPGC